MLTVGRLVDREEDELDEWTPEDGASALELRQRIEQCLATLTPREELVIRLRFGLDGEGEQSLEAVGKIFGVRRERIRQIEGKAFRKLRWPGRAKKLKPFIDGEEHSGIIPDTRGVPVVWPEAPRPMSATSVSRREQFSLDLEQARREQFSLDLEQARLLLPNVIRLAQEQHLRFQWASEEFQTTHDEEAYARMRIAHERTGKLVAQGKRIERDIAYLSMRLGLPLATL